MKRINLIIFTTLWVTSLPIGMVAAQESFTAVGPTTPIVQYLEEPGWPVPEELERIAVEIKFDMVPTKMRFSMPCYPSMVTENDIHFSNGWTETYDPYRLEFL